MSHSTLGRKATIPDGLLSPSAVQTGRVSVLVLLSLICSTGEDCHNFSGSCREDKGNCMVVFQD